jgi:hypothetical protein
MGSFGSFVGCGSIFIFHPQVSCARLNDYLLRHNELHVWLLLGPNSANQAIAEEDLGGLYWGRI